MNIPSILALSIVLSSAAVACGGNDPNQPAQVLPSDGDTAGATGGKTDNASQDEYGKKMKTEHDDTFQVKLEKTVYTSGPTEFHMIMQLFYQVDSDYLLDFAPPWEMFGKGPTWMTAPVHIAMHRISDGSDASVDVTIKLDPLEMGDDRHFVKTHYFDLKRGYVLDWVSVGILTASTGLTDGLLGLEGDGSYTLDINLANET